VIEKHMWPSVDSLEDVEGAWASGYLRSIVG